MLRLLFVAGWLSLATAAPQGLLDGLSNLLTSVVGGSPTGEVDNYENAPYTLVRSFDGYEERFYPRQTWVCTRSGGFRSLFNYISGSNSAGSKLEMTVPVMMTESEKGSEMCFYLPASAQGSPPQPSASGVYLDTKKAMSVYATTAGGFPNKAQQAAALKDRLQRGRASQVDFSTYYSLSYDSPWKMVNRRNDVMYRKL